MKKNELLAVFIIYYILFNKKIIPYNIIIEILPKNVFGVFTTIRRFKQIISWPKDIHGCIGYWNNLFNNLTPKEIFDNLLDVSYKALFNDDRNKYFTPIETDSNSYLEIDFMLNPVYKIDNNGMITELNILFTNNIFGIIIQTKNNKNKKKATFLPNVFLNISWNDIIISIKKKSGITDEEFELFAYKIKQIKYKFVDILINNIFSYINIYQFSRFLINNMKQELEYPFIYSCNEKSFSWNYTDDVRNISILGDIIKYNKYYPNILSKNELNFIMNKIFNILKNTDKYSSQALSFLGHIYSLYKINNSEIFCNKLFSALSNAEPEFEKSEIIIGLHKAGCKLNIENDLLTYTIDDSIFKMNWIIQTLFTLQIKISFNLKKIVELKINSIIFKIKKIETNYIAVSFECLCFLYTMTNDIKILNKLFELFFELEKRKNSYILYQFIDKTARVDITAHVNNGLLLLNNKIIS